MKIQTVLLADPSVPHGNRIMMHLLLWQLELPKAEDNYFNPVSLKLSHYSIIQSRKSETTFNYIAYCCSD